MAVTARIGAVHLGWDVVSVAAGGGGAPIRPVQVEGTYTPPAYLLADSSGRLHTAGVDRRPDVGIAISDVRDIIGHPQIVVAGATWPADLVFRARLHNPLAEITKHLGAPPDVVAVPFPDDWPDAKVEEFMRLVEQFGVAAEPLPESVALSGYVRALGLVRAPGRGPAVGATGVYSDGRECLVVAVDGDDEQPTESVSVAITPEALHQARAADNVVIEVMAAARAVGADTSTVLLAGNVCFNDALRLAFQNHLGHRFQVAEHPMHALVLGATHLLANDSELAEEHAKSAVRQPDSAGPAVENAPGGVARHAGQPGRPNTGEIGATPRHGQGAPVGPASGPIGQVPESVSGSAEARPLEQGPRHVEQPHAAQPHAAQQQAVPPHAAKPQAAQPQAAPPRPPAVQPHAAQPGQRQPDSLSKQPENAQRQADSAQPGEFAAPASGSRVETDPSGVEQTRRMTPEDLAQTPIASRGGLPPGLAGVGGRFTRPPGTPADDQMTSIVGRTPQPGAGEAGQPGAQQGSPGAFGPAQGSPQQGANPAGGQGYPPAYGSQPGGPGYAGGTPGQPPAPQGAPNAGGYGPPSGYPQQGGGCPQQGGYGPAGGGYGAPGGPQGPEGGGYHPEAGGRGSFAGTSGNAPGQAGSMYGGSMPSSGSRQNPQSSEDVAGQSDSESGAEGERKPRKGKLWKKMKGNIFGAPILIGAATLAALGMHSDSEPLPLARSGPSSAMDQLRALPRLVGDVCALTPFAVDPQSGISGIDDPRSQECLRMGIDTLRYTIPGPVRGADPGPPRQI